MIFNNKDTIKARRLAQEVRDLCKKYDLPFFFVTDGASSCDTRGHDAINHARKAHTEWEKKNGIDPNHDWSGNINS
jgi:hypothetical protein